MKYATGCVFFWVRNPYNTLAERFRDFVVVELFFLFLGEVAVFEGQVPGDGHALDEDDGVGQVDAVDWSREITVAEPRMLGP